jgi:hypothetical protein
MSGKLTWDGDRAARQIRAELKQRLARAALVVWNRAKELINTEGTGIRAETSAELGSRLRREGHAERKRQKKEFRRFEARMKRDRIAFGRAKVRAEIKAWNQGNKAGISIGKVKRARMTKAGTISFRRAPLRNNDASGFARRHGLK